MFNDKDFFQQFSISKKLFAKLVDEVIAHDLLLIQKRDAIDKLGLSSIQKYTMVV